MQNLQNLQNSNLRNSRLENSRLENASLQNSSLQNSTLQNLQNTMIQSSLPSSANSSSTNSTNNCLQHSIQNHLNSSLQNTISSPLQNNNSAFFKSPTQHNVMPQMLHAPNYPDSNLPIIFKEFLLSACRNSNLPISSNLVATNWMQILQQKQLLDLIANVKKEDN